MTSKLGKYEELNSSSKTMKYMHSATGEKNNRNDPNNTLFSIHQRGKHKTLWYMSSWEIMEAQNSPTNPEMVTYKSKIYPYNALYRTILTTRTPNIKAKEGHQIRFCEDLFINMIKEFKLMFNDIELQVGNDKFLMFDLKNRNNWDNLSEEIGNKEGLTTWSDEIKGKDISISLPWFYTNDKSDSFPLKFCGHNDRLHHIIEYKLSLRDLLLMRDSDGNIVDYQKEYLDIENNIESLPIPEMEGLYTVLTNRECDINNCTLDEVDGEKELYTNSIYYIENENEVNMDKRVQLKLDGKFKQPVTSIYWGAVNKTKSELLKSTYFNYNKDGDIHSPVKYSKIETSIGNIVDNKGSYKTERAYNLVNERVMSKHTGMNRWSNSVLDREDGRKFKPGIKFNAGKITVSLKSKDNDDKWLIFAICNNIRRFKIKNFPKKQEDRLKMGCTIEPDEDD